MAKKRPQSKNQKAYNKELQRIKRFIRRAEKRGYQFEEGVVPKKPKKITPASVRRLKRITPNYLYGKAVYGGEATGGEIVSGRRGRLEERKAAARKGHKKNTSDSALREVAAEPSFYDKVVISHWYGQLREFSRGEAYNLLRSWMGQLIEQKGLHDVATMLQTAIDNGVILTWEQSYNEEATERYIGSLLEYMPDEGVLYKEQQLDKLEYMKTLGNALEQDENWAYPL